MVVIVYFGSSAIAGLLLVLKVIVYLPEFKFVKLTAGNVTVCKFKVFLTVLLSEYLVLLLESLIIYDTIKSLFCASLTEQEGEKLYVLLIDGLYKSPCVPEEIKGLDSTVCTWFIKEAAVV